MINWNTLSIRKKILLSFASLLALFVIAGSIMMSSLIHINQSAKDLHQNQIPTLSLANQMESEWQQAIFHFRSYALHKNDEYYFNGVLHLDNTFKLVDSLKLKIGRQNEIFDKIEHELDQFRERAYSGREATRNIHLNYLKLDSASHQLQDFSKRYLSLQYIKLKADLDKKEEDAIIKRRVDKINLMTEIVSITEKIKTTIGEANYLNNPELLNNLTESFPNIHKNINIIRPVTTKQYDLDALYSIEKLADQCHQAVDSLNKSWLNNSYFTDHKQSETGILLIRDLTNNLESATRGIAKSYQEQTFRAQVSWWIWLLLIVISGITLSFIISNSFSKPLIYLTKISEMQEKGYFPAIETKNRKDEIGALLSAMKSGQEHTRKLVKNIQEMASSIDILINRLHQKSIDLSTAGNNQAASTEEITASIEEMSTLSQNNRQRATDSLAKNKATSELLFSHLENTTHTLQLMEELMDKANSINELAMQSYIVAINASVEAAKSEQNGRGFSIIAKSMRELAEKIRFSADEISSLIKKGRLITSVTNENMDQVKFWIEQNNSILQIITESFYKQDNETSQVNINIQHLNLQTQKSSLLAEEIAKEANQLGKQSLKLHSLLEFYKLEHNVFDTNEIAHEALNTNNDHLYSTKGRQIFSDNNVETILT